ncbi:endolytic transglycosylase MltG [Streptococcus sp. DD13]|uniref:endolytic transglycosylase MltG n=1 Tax=Streptococcus sp. DD13 TaxID=1777881 RepID=UPI0007980E8C|nr:endolytic transglycosylase MltG [Streptococcus sp. DD13]KXT78198.1 protein YceG like [Streptococcus sp. DD13]
MANDLNDKHTEGRPESQSYQSRPQHLEGNEEKAKLTDQQQSSDSVHQDTVERNLSLLRQMVAQQEAELHQADQAVESSAGSLPEEEGSLDSDATRVFSEPLVPAESTREDTVEVKEEALDEKTVQLTPPLTDKSLTEDEDDMPRKDTKASRRHTHSKKAKKELKRQERASRKIALTVIAILIIGLGIAGYTGWNYVSSSLGPLDRSNTTYVQVEIPSGTSTSQIGKLLEEKKLIKNATIFSLYARLKSYNNFQSGYYNLRPSMSVDEIAQALQDKGSETATEPVLGRVRVIEGYTIDQIAANISDNVMTDDTTDKTPYTSDAFLKAVKDTSFIQRMKEKYPQLLGSLPAANSGVKYQLEGYLYPATYDYHEGESVEDLIDQMLGTLNTYLTSYYSQIEKSGYSVNEILTLASLVEKEGVRDEDRRNIASVFYNRLNAGMPLQSNVALHYAAGNLGSTSTIADDAQVDTQMDSPYNIYIHTGLMPGPVDSPSIDAIKWTIQPNQTNYYYFVADMQSRNKDIYFAQTLEEHNKNVAEHVNAYLTGSSSSGN